MNNEDMCKNYFRIIDYIRYFLSIFLLFIFEYPN